MRLAYAYHLDANRPAVQSGRPHSILTNLRGCGVEVEELFPLDENTKWQRRAHKIFCKLTGRESLSDRHEPLLRHYAQLLEGRLSGVSVDAVFCPSTLPLSYLETDLPVSFCADAPLAAMLDYYGSFSRLSTAQRELSEKLEARVLGRAALAVYPSQWAAKAAVEHYRIPAERVAVIPFGANLGANHQLPQILEAIDRRPTDVIRLLFIGKEWDRKGGKIALETAKLLRKRGFKVMLHVVGCRPVRDETWVKCHGLLSRSQPREREKLTDLLLSCHFMLVPSRAEAYGMVFCEANAAGLPAITTDTGGISEIVRDGCNGYKLPVAAAARDYADVIEEAFVTAGRYRELALSSFAEFESRLNWRTHCETFVAELAQRIEAQVPPEIPPVSLETAVPVPPRCDLRLGYISNDYLNPLLVGSWSGLSYFVRRGLEAQGVEIVPIPLRDGIWKYVVWMKFLVYRYVFRKRYLRDRHPGLLRHYARQIEQQIKDQPPDILFCPGTAPLAFLRTKIPIVFWSDATFSGMQDFYDAYTNLAAVSLRDGHRADQAALHRTSLALYSSQWAADHARFRYEVSSEKVKVVPFGANLATDPGREEVEQAIDRRPAEICRLLFIGVDWVRKGADHAIAVAAALRRKGCVADLTIVGCLPPEGTVLPEFITCTGFVSKGTEEGRQAIIQLFTNSHFFILPTRAEAYGLVFCEANAFGVPVLATRTGGIESIVQPGINGVLFPLEASPEDYAEEVIKWMADIGAYRSLARQARAEYEKRLNWDASIARFLHLVEEILPQAKGRHA